MKAQNPIVIRCSDCGRRYYIEQKQTTCGCIHDVNSCLKTGSQAHGNVSIENPRMVENPPSGVNRKLENKIGVVINNQSSDE